MSDVPSARPPDCEFELGELAELFFREEVELAYGDETLWPAIARRLLLRLRDLADQFTVTGEDPDGPLGRPRITLPKRCWHDGTLISVDLWEATLRYRLLGQSAFLRLVGIRVEWRWPGAEAEPFPADGGAQGRQSRAELLARMTTLCGGDQADGALAARRGVGGDGDPHAAQPGGDDAGDALAARPDGEAADEASRDAVNRDATRRECAAFAFIREILRDDPDVPTRTLLAAVQEAHGDAIAIKAAQAEIIRIRGRRRTGRRASRQKGQIRKPGQG